MIYSFMEFSFIYVPRFIGMESLMLSTEKRGVFFPNRNFFYDFINFQLKIQRLEISTNNFHF